MKVLLVPEKCIACGLCQTYSKLFDYHDDGIVKFKDSDAISQTISDADTKTLSAVKSCPTKALTIL